jgi:choline dehydrogenase
VAYLHPAMNRHNLTVMTAADVVCIAFEGKRAVGVEAVHRIEALRRSVAKRD